MQWIQCTVDSRTGCVFVLQDSVSMVHLCGEEWLPFDLEANREPHTESGPCKCQEFAKHWAVQWSDRSDILEHLLMGLSWRHLQVINLRQSANVSLIFPNHKTSPELCPGWVLYPWFQGKWLTLFDWYHWIFLSWPSAILLGWSARSFCMCHLYSQVSNTVAWFCLQNQFFQTSKSGPAACWRDWRGLHVVRVSAKIGQVSLVKRIESELWPKNHRMKRDPHPKMTKQFPLGELQTPGRISLELQRQTFVSQELGILSLDFQNSNQVKFFSNNVAEKCRMLLTPAFQVGKYHSEKCHHRWGRKRSIPSCRRGAGILPVCALLQHAFSEAGQRWTFSSGCSCHQNSQHQLSFSQADFWGSLRKWERCNLTGFWVENMCRGAGNCCQRISNGVFSWVWREECTLQHKEWWTPIAFLSWSWTVGRNNRPAQHIWLLFCWQQGTPSSTMWHCLSSLLVNCGLWW